MSRRWSSLIASLIVSTSSFVAVSLVAAPVASAASVGGVFTDYGGGVNGITRFEGAFGRTATGVDVAYNVNFGPAAEFSVSTVTGSPNTTLYRKTLPGAHGSHSIAVASDGTVYFGTYPNGRLYRYNPVAGTVTDLGQPVAGAQYIFGISPSTDGRISFGTYPSGRAFVYSPSAGLTDLGVVGPGLGNYYTRATGFDTIHNRVYVGVGSAGFRIYSVDIATKAQQLIGSGYSDFPTDMTVMERRVLVNAAGTLVLIDTDANAVIPARDAADAPVTSFSAVSRGFSRPRDYLSYFTTFATVGGVEEKHLATYDFRTDQVLDTGIQMPVNTALGYGWSTIGGELTLLMTVDNYGDEYGTYVPATGQTGSGHLAMPLQPQQLFNVLAHPDGRHVVADAFLNGNTSILDPSDHTLTAGPRLGQVESWIADGSTIYAGVYPDATLYRYDTTATPAAREEIATLHDHVPDGGNRPWALLKVGSTLYAGTAPYYGQNGGAIASVDVSGSLPATPTITRNVVTNHSIAALGLMPNGHLLAGTSTQGGDGAPSVSGPGQLVEWNPATRTVVRSVVPNAAAGSVNALLVEGNTAYGLAGTMLFEFNLSTWSMTRTASIPGAGWCGGGGDGEIRRHPYNGLLYISCGTNIYESTNGFAISQVPIGRSTSRLDIGRDGNLYFAVDPATPGWMSNVGSWRPNHPATVGCTGTASLYGIIDLADGAHLTYTAISVRGNQNPSGALVAAAPLPFQIRTLASYNFNTLFATSTAGLLYQINIQSVYGTLMISSVNQVGYGWSNFDKLTSDGSYLYGTTTTGALMRYPVSLAKPASTFGAGVQVGTGFVLDTLAAAAPSRLVATTNTGELVGYYITPAGSWQRSSLKPSTWIFENLVGSDGILYAQKPNGELWGYRDTNPADGSGADLYGLGPVGLFGWSQRLLAAVPDSSLC